MVVTRSTRTSPGCHAEVGHYSKDHPRGRKFTKTELKKHRDQWLEICRTKPEVFTNAAASPEIGPLQALADELEVNITISAVAADLASKRSSWASPPPFLDGEFKRAVSAGALAVLPEELRRAIIGAYVLARGVNARAPIFEGTGEDGMAARTANEQTAQARARALPPLDEAWRELRAFMVAMNEKGLAEE